MRNNFQKTLMAGLIFGIPAFAAINHAIGQTPKRPNILFIAVDDMNSMVGALGGPAVTPNIESQGTVIYKNTFAGGNDPGDKHNNGFSAFSLSSCDTGRKW